MTSIKDFLDILDGEEGPLLRMGFCRMRINQKGQYTVYIDYQKAFITVKFMYGPPEYHVEVVIYSDGREIGFKDMLRIPGVADLLKKSRTSAVSDNQLKKEISFFMGVLQIAIPSQFPDVVEHSS